MARRKTKVTKGEMVRQALEAGATKPIEGTAWIKEKFGVQMKPNNFSNFKTMQNKGSGSSVARTPAARTSGGNGVGIRLEELTTLRILVDRVGAKGIAEAVSLLS